MLTPEEQAIVDFGAKQGKKSKEILGALSKFRAENKPIEVKPIFDAPVKPKSTLADVPSDIMDFGAGVKSVVGSAGDRQKGILDAYATGEQGFLRTVGQSSANLASAVSGVAGEGLKLVAKLFASPEAEDFYANAAKTAGEKVLSAPVAVKLIKDYEEVKKTDPVAARDAVALAQGGEFLLNFLGLKAAEKVGEATLKAGEKTLATGLKTGEQVVTKADDIIRQTDEVLTQEAKQALPPLPPDATPAMIRARAELEKPTMTLSEKWIGLQPDIKKQIAQNPEKLSQYIDVVKARNADVNLPTAYEIGGNEARRATAEMQKVLNETGGEIGQTRQRLGNIRYNQPQIKEIEATFLKELEKLNLTVKNGQVVQKAGALSRVGSANDIKVANDLYREFLKFKQNPNLTNGIDLRNAFDSKINFAKSAGEASTAIDPLSRQTRRVIADSSAQLVGKTEAKKLADYTQFMEAFNDIKSYTDRAAGGEYLLRLVLSGRGGEARQIIETIRKYTGINLMDDAVMMTTVTDMLGNQTQKTLFSQQVTSAGLDVAKILSGNPQGAIPLLTKFLQQKLVDTEGVLKGAAGIKPEPLKIPTVNEISDKLKGQRGFISAGYVDEGALTTKILSKLEGKKTVSRQFIEDLTNSGDVRQAERDLIRKTLEDFKGGDINVSEFANKVKTELLPLKRASGRKNAANPYDKYESITLPAEQRGPVANYSEHVYESPISTSAGQVHFEGHPNYFAHTRIEDLADNQTRRVIEAQSDLFQKGRLEQEKFIMENKARTGISKQPKAGETFIKFASENELYPSHSLSANEINKNISKTIAQGYTKNDVAMFNGMLIDAKDALTSLPNSTKIKNKINFLEGLLKELNSKNIEINPLTKLEPYRNTWHERIIREEIKQAAIDGKTKLQFPTGETAMKIEGLGENNNWLLGTRGNGTPLTPEILSGTKGNPVGSTISQNGEEWIITDVLGDGKFKAVPKREIELQLKNNSELYQEYIAKSRDKDPFTDGFNNFVYDLRNKNVNKDLLEGATESFDISGKVDTNNPIYKFYEKDVQKFLNKFGGKKITDAQGVSWIEVPITKEMGKSPVQAFGKTSVGALQTMAGVAGALAAAPLIAGAIQKVAQGLDSHKEAMDIVSSQIGSGSTMGNDAYNEAVGIVKYLLQNGNAQELEKFISDQQIKMNE